MASSTLSQQLGALNEYVCHPEGMREFESGGSVIAVRGDCTVQMAYLNRWVQSWVGHLSTFCKDLDTVPWSRALSRAG